MKGILLTASMALGTLSSAAYAEPVALTDTQMDGITAGVYYTYRTEEPYFTQEYRRYQNQRTYIYDPENEEFARYGQTRFQWWRDYPEEIGQLYFRYQADGEWQYVPYATYFAPEGGYGGPYTNEDPPTFNDGDFNGGNDTGF